MRRLIISEQDAALFNSPFDSAMCSTYLIYTKEIRRMVKQQGEGFWIQFVTSFRSYAVSRDGTEDIPVSVAEDAFIDMLMMLSSNDNLLQLSEFVRSLKALNKALLAKDFHVVMHPMLRYLCTRFSKPFVTIKLYFRFFTSFMTLFHRWEVSHRARSSSPLASWIPPVHWTNLGLFRNYGRSKFEMYLKAGWGKMLLELLRLTKSQICWLEVEGSPRKKSRRNKRRRQRRKMKAEASRGKDNELPKTAKDTGNNAGSASTKSEEPKVSVENSSGAIGKVHPHQPPVNKRKMSDKEKNDSNCMENVSEPSCHSRGNAHGKKAKSVDVKKGNNKKQVEKLEEKCVNESGLQNESSNDVTKNKASDNSEPKNKSTLKTASDSSGYATLDVNSNVQGKNPVPCKDHASKILKQSSDEVRKRSVKSRSQPVKTSSTSANCGDGKKGSRIFTKSNALDNSNNESVLSKNECNVPNSITANVTKTKVEKVLENENITLSNVVSADDHNNPRTLYLNDVNNDVEGKNTVGWCKETMCNGKELSSQKDSRDGHAKISPSLCSETVSNDGSKLKKPLSLDESYAPKITSVNVLQGKGDAVGTPGKFVSKADGKRSFSNDLHDRSSSLLGKKNNHQSVGGYLSKDCSSKGKGTRTEDQKREVIVNEASIHSTLSHGNEQKVLMTSDSTGEEDSSGGDAVGKHVDAYTSGKESSRLSSGDSCNVAHTSVKSETKNEINKDNDFKKPYSPAEHIPGEQSHSIIESVTVPNNKIKHSQSVKNVEDAPQRRTIENSDSFSEKGSTYPKAKAQPEDPCPKEEVHSHGTSYGRPLPPPRQREKIFLYRKCDTCNILEHTPGCYKSCSQCISEEANRPKIYCGVHCQYVDWIRAHKKEHQKKQKNKQ